MSEDVNEHSHRQRPVESNALLSKLRNNFSSIGSLFFSSNANISGKSSHFNDNDDDEVLNGQEFCDPVFPTAQDFRDSAYYHHDNHNSQLLASPFSGLDVDTPTPTRSTTPRNNLFDQTRSYSAAAHLSFNRHSRQSQYPENEDALTEICLSDAPSISSDFTVAASPPSHSSPSDGLSLSYSVSFDLDDTPPLSPATDSSFGTYPSVISLGPELELAQRNLHHQHGNNYNGLYKNQSNREQIKEGKKPERAICYDTLIHDVSGTQDLKYQTNTRPSIDDADEWYGLEYTLELSCKERRPSETYSCDESVGESSRSRESWAALRRGQIHPFFEDEDYYQWKNWHLHLDREDEKRKHRKGFEFRARSRNLAWYYLNEMRTREVMYWQLEVFGMIGRDVKERLASLVQHRPDPYYPPKKHNLGWYLKRSRSIACLRELEPQSTPALIGRGGRPKLQKMIE